MRMLETTLLTGPYDWDPALLPRSEFDRRIGFVRLMLDEYGLSGVIVGGTSPEHGALGYLTGFVPKLGPALAFIPPRGDLRLVCSGGGAMLSSAQRLTFISDVRAMRDPEQEIAAWLREAGGKRFGLCGNSAITNDVRRAIDKTVPQPVMELDGSLDALRRHKSACEQALVRRACEILDVGLRELRAATENGKGVRTAALAGERASYANGAQDFRILLSMSNGGTPQPLIGTADPRVNPLLACVAVRFAGYWSEGLATIASTPSEARDRAEAGLAGMLREIRPGTPPAILVPAAIRTLRGAKLHPFVRTCAGNGIGLSREEVPNLVVGELTSLEEGDICTLRAGAQLSATDSAIVSAMIRVGADGAEVLWKSPGSRVA
jgi:Xaa-Pro aminopeptidase